MNSKIILAHGIKMDRGYSNVLSYTEQQMVNLCLTNQIAQADDYSFIRQNRNSISTHFTYSQCLQANYIAFQNTDYSGKWFFAWIDDVIYKSNGTTEIQYTIDYWSTWFDYWQKKPCFIVREHVNDDTIGLHTVNEDVSVGEVICEEEISDIAYDIYDRENDEIRNHWIAIETNYIPVPDTSTDSPDPKGSQFAGVNVVNSILTGSRYVFFYMNSANLSSSVLNISRFIYRVNQDGHIEDIKNLFAVPSNIISPSNLDTYQASSENATNYQSGLFTWFSLNTNTFNPVQYEQTISKNRSFIDYPNVKNNKLFCYPYNYLFVSNNNGGSNIYKYEDFISENCVFLNQLALCLGVQGRLIPMNYKRISHNDDESIPLAKYPTFSWSSDAYINWLTQNAINLNTQVIGIGLSAGSSAINLATGNPDKAVSEGTSAINQAFSLMDRFYKADLLPNIVGGNSTGDLSYSGGKMGYRYYKMIAKPEYLQIIDDYFSKFGYKINRVKLPNIVGRTNWNYLKIASGEEIGYGDVPSRAMEQINTACRNGVTIWHSHTNLGNFSLDNSIV